MQLFKTTNMEIIQSCQYNFRFIIIIIIIIMQRLTRHVSVIRLTNRRRGVAEYHSTKENYKIQK